MGVLVTATGSAGTPLVGIGPTCARGVGPGQHTRGVRRAARVPAPLMGSLPAGLGAVGAQLVAGAGDTGQLWEWPSLRPLFCFPLDSRVGLRGSTIELERSRAN